MEMEEGQRGRRRGEPYGGTELLFEIVPLVQGGVLKFRGADSQEPNGKMFPPAANLPIWQWHVHEGHDWPIAGRARSLGQAVRRPPVRTTKRGPGTLPTRIRIRMGVLGPGYWLHVMPVAGRV